MTDTAAFTWLPASRATDEDVEAVLGPGGASGAAKCRCQRLKAPPRA